MAVRSQPADPTTGPGEASEKAPDLGYRILPAAGFHVLTPWFDLLAGLLGFGRGFKARVVDQAGIMDGMRVLDVGCGSGITALTVKQRHPRCEVVGVDADPRILRIARRRALVAGVSAVEFVCAPAERTGLAAASIDAALSTLTFHHLPPRAKEEAAREVARVLRHGGSFLLVDLRPLIPLRRPLTDEERRSPRMALRTNTPQALSALLAAAGLQVREEPAPKPWSYAPWTFALRALKAG